MRTLLLLLYAYGIVGVLSLLVIPASAKGWFGLEPDPLAAVFAILLASPWGLPVQGMLPGDSPWLAGSLLSACISLNLLGRNAAIASNCVECRSGADVRCLHPCRHIALAMEDAPNADAV
ncbi:MAG: hypothetical protein JSS14_15075 [Proteobacteria bacterium]|nr:hypothetical protein [Pseudomonadota bacterium]